MGAGASDQSKGEPLGALPLSPLPLFSLTPGPCLSPLLPIAQRLDRSWYVGSLAALCDIAARSGATLQRLEATSE